MIRIKQRVTKAPGLGFNTEYRIIVGDHDISDHVAGYTVETSQEIGGTVTSLVLKMAGPVKFVGWDEEEEQDE